MTTTQLDTLQRLARRVNAASLAVGALGDGPDHDAVAELLVDIAGDLRAFAGEVRA